MSADAGRVREPLYVRGRDMVLSYLSDAAWEVEDDDAVETLGTSGGYGRIRIAVTDGPTWSVPRSCAHAPGRPDCWWAFVRLTEDRHELFLAAEQDVRERVHRLLVAPDEETAGPDDGATPDADDEAGTDRADEADHDHDELGQDGDDETVRLADDDVRPMARRWGELAVG